MKKKKKGICRLCGEWKELSFEHIPPRRNFNNGTVTIHTLEAHFRGRAYTIFQKGVGALSLCEGCNHRTGRWYGPAYASWVLQGVKWLNELSENSSWDIPFYIMPLNVLKQVIVMALAMTSEPSVPYHEELRYFVLNPTQKYLPSRYNIYAYLTGNEKKRFESGMAVMNHQTGATSYIDAEVAFPPFGYCMTSARKQTNASLAERKGLYDIGWFSHFDYNLWTTVYLHLPKLQANTYFPLDYRTVAEIEQEAAEADQIFPAS